MGWIWFVVVVAFVIAFSATIFSIFARGARASRGGVEHPDADKHRGNPPFESIERHTR